MNIDFGSNHMQTLADLQALAEKHNCKITFGFYSNSDHELDDDVLEKHGFTEEMREELRDSDLMLIKDCTSTFEKVWFELLESNGKSNTMAYIQSGTYFIAELEDSFYREKEASDELIAKLEERDEMYYTGQYTINLSHNPTIIYGFGNKEKVEDYRVYRSGMALHFFSNLVCDYLNEPRIKRVY